MSNKKLSSDDELTIGDVMSGQEKSTSKPETTTSLLDAIEASASELNKVSDAANNLVQELESILVDKYSIGLNVIVDINESISQADIRELSFAKHGKSWRIVVSYMDYEIENQYSKPWLECSREIKLHTIKYLPELLRAIRDDILVTLRKASDAISSVKESIGSKR